MNIAIPEVHILYRASNSDIIQELPVNAIYCVGKNFADHAAELHWINKELVFFQKTRTGLKIDEQEIVLPGFSNEVHYEIELVLYIGKKGKNIAVSQAMDHILAVGLGVDFTARDIQRNAKENGHPWTIAKGFDDSAYVSTMIQRPDINEILQWDMYLRRDAQLRQKGSVDQMVLKPDEIIAELSSYLTLHPGDIVFTGTPPGVGSVYSGNEVEIELKNGEKSIIKEKFLIT